MGLCTIRTISERACRVLLGLCHDVVRVKERGDRDARVERAGVVLVLQLCGELCACLNRRRALLVCWDLDKRKVPVHGTLAGLPSKTPSWYFFCGLRTAKTLPVSYVLCPIQSRCRS